MQIIKILIKTWNMNNKAYWWRKNKHVEIANIMHIDVRQADNGRPRNFCSHGLPLSWSFYFRILTQCIVLFLAIHICKVITTENEVWKEEGVSPMESIGEAAESDVKMSHGKFRETPTSKRNNRSSKRKKIEITRPLYLYRFDTMLRFVSRCGSMNERSCRRLSRHIGRWGCAKSLSLKTSTEIEAKEGKIARDSFFEYSELKKWISL